MDLNYSLSDERRKLMLKIWSGVGGHDSPITQALHYLDCHFPPCALDDALRYLIRNGLIGKAFVELLAGFKNSHLELHRFLISKLEHEKKMRPLFGGKDVLQ